VPAPRRRAWREGAHRDAQEVDVVAVAGAPDRGQQLGVADHGSRALGEMAEQAVLGRRQVDLGALGRDAMAAPIDDQPGCLISSPAIAADRAFVRRSTASIRAISSGKLSGFVT